MNRSVDLYKLAEAGISQPQISPPRDSAPSACLPASCLSPHRFLCTPVGGGTTSRLSLCTIMLDMC